MNQIIDLIKLEEKRQHDTLMMIPSENYASKVVRGAVGSVLMNKYSEGYPERRYYQGNKIIDEIETLAVEKAKKLFKVPYANVQPYSGSPANSEILFALANPNDTIMGMSLSSGGHLTHGHPDITFSGKYFKSIQFDLDEKGLLDYKKIEYLAEREKPKVLFIGTTAYPLALNWKKFSEIADKAQSWLVADISHVIGLIIAGVYPSPFPFAHIVTTTTHKTLRGPRGAMILTTDKGIKKDNDLAQKIDKAVFPGMQGGPHNNTTAAIAIALDEASTTNFKNYGKQVVKNARALADELQKLGLTLVSGGTECHLMVIDLREKKLSGNVVADALEIAGIIVNKNSVPNDIMPPFYPSGIRLGTPAVTTRGMGEKEMKQIAFLIKETITYVSSYKLPDNPQAKKRFMQAYRKTISKDKFLLKIGEEVRVICSKFPLE